MKAIKIYFVSVILFMFSLCVSSQCNYSYGKWDTTLSPMPVERFIFSAVLHDSLIYVIGGGIPGGVESDYVSSVDVYNPATDTWNIGLTELPFPRACPNACLIDNKIYVLGGLDFGDAAPIIYDSVHIYDIESNTWEIGQNIPTSVSVFGADTINGKIYVAGGGTNDWGIVNNVYMYDPELDEWTEKASMNKTRRASCAKSWNGKLYVFGGYTGSSWSVSSSIEVYDPELDEWTMLTNATIPRSIMGMSRNKNQLLVFGGIHGYSGSTYHYNKTISRYNLQTDMWFNFHQQDDDLPANRQFPVPVIVEEKVYLFGGYVDGNPQRNIWTYSLKSIWQNMEISDTLISEESIEIDLNKYFANSTGEEQKYNICQEGGEELIGLSINNSILKIEKLTEGGGSTNITVNAFNSVDTISSNTFVLEAPVGVYDNDEDQIAVYPNPVSGKLTIELSSGIYNKGNVFKMHLYNILGIDMLNGTIENADMDMLEVDMTGMSTGMYILVIENNNSAYRINVVKE